MINLEDTPNTEWKRTESTMEMRKMKMSWKHVGKTSERQRNNSALFRSIYKKKINVERLHCNRHDHVDG